MRMYVRPRVSVLLCKSIYSDMVVSLLVNHICYFLPPSLSLTFHLSSPRPYLPSLLSFPPLPSSSPIFISPPSSPSLHSLPPLPFSTPSLLSLPPTSLPLKAYRVVYPFSSRSEDELDLNDGDYIYVSTVDNGRTESDGWLRGTSHNTGMTGVFPANYVERAKDSDLWVLHR